MLSLCGETPANEHDCDLQLLALDGSVPKPIAAASTPEFPETSPTLWLGTIAFVRAPAQRSARGVPQVYTRPLDAPRSRRSTRRPGVPTKRCSQLVDPPASPPACRTRNRSVSELELPPAPTARCRASP